MNLLSSKVTGRPRLAASCGCNAVMVCNNMIPPSGSALREPEEVGIAFEAEMFEGADGYDPVDRLVELPPILQPHTTGA
jgi:hypothetical protein